MLGARRRVQEVPAAQLPLLAVHDQHAFAGEDEEALLRVLLVVEAQRLQARGRAAMIATHDLLRRDEERAVQASGSMASPTRTRPGETTAP
jgi:hypothetical protein